MKSNTEINELVAKALGFTPFNDGVVSGWNYPTRDEVRGSQYFKLPDFCESLDACEKWIEPQCESTIMLIYKKLSTVTVRVNIETTYRECMYTAESTAKAWCLAFLEAKRVEV